MTGRVFISTEIREEWIADIFKKIYPDGHANETSTCKIIGDPRRLKNHDTLCLSSLFMTAYKRACLEKNERQMLVGSEDNMIAVQLCLAEINRENVGEFDVEMSKVLEMCRKVNKKKLTASESQDLFDNDEDDELTNIYDKYQEFLACCNLFDLVDLFRAVQENSALDVVKSIFSGDFLILQSPSSEIELEMLKYLCRGKKLVRVVCEEDLSQEDHCDVVMEDLESAEDVASLLKQSCPLSSPVSVTEGYVQSVFISYLHLLVNSRNELALARVINVPDRDLDHQAFTNIKRVAKQKNMSMCQVVLSYVIKIRLGGKSYAPDPNSPLALHVKGLSEFTDLIHKLQMFAEEDPDVNSSLTRVIKLIKNTIIKCKDSLIKREAVERVAEKLTTYALSLSENVEELYGKSPERKACDGGSALGRKTLKVLRVMVDEESALPCTSKTVNILSDAISSQKTPIRFPCLLSKFKSPENLDELINEPELNTPLSHRLKAKFEDKPKRPLVPRFQACMDWAGSKTEIGLENKDSHILTEKEIKLIEKAKSKCNIQAPKMFEEKDISCTKTNKKPVESILDQENIGVLTHTETCGKQTIKSKTNKDKSKPSAGSRKRKKDSDSEETNSNLNKKVKKAPTASKSKKSKTAVIPSGQKRMTDFFRL